MSDADRSHSDPDSRRGFSFFGRPHKREEPDTLGARAGQVIADFRLIRSLGTGGMGQVWEAEQQSLGRLVALKLVRPDRVSEKTLALFAREARAGGRLHHPNLVSVHAHGTDGGIAWIAMELVEGGWTLRDFLDEAAKEPQVPAGYYQDAARFVAAVADGMQAAHAEGVIHRDLKPQNILIDPEDRPKVTDFGLAKLIDESALSVSGEVTGTYWYMSPEQVAAKRIGLDHRTDVFSLGVVLYELLSHRRPFEGDTSRQVAEQIVTHDPPELRTVRSRIPRDLAVITAKCLEKARDRRYGTMAELAADLRRYLKNEPILAKPPSRLVKVGLWMRRNPTKSVAGGVAVVAFGIISVLLAENVRARAALGRSNENLEAQTQVAHEEAERAERLAEAERLAARAAEASAASEKRRADEVLRLSAIQDYEDLLAEADRLWPPYPDRISAYEAWITRAESLTAELPRHRAKRSELLLKALPETPEVREASRSAHPAHGDLLALERELHTLRAALAMRRDGVRPELPDLPADKAALDADALNAAAWPLVDPGRSERGREAEGLMLGLAALARCAPEDDERAANIGDTIAWGYFALGLDEEALAAEEAAVARAQGAVKVELRASLETLQAQIAAASSDHGLAESTARISAMEKARVQLDEQIEANRARGYPDTEAGRSARWWNGNLTKLIEALEGLEEPKTGLLSSAADAVSEDHGWSVARRLEFAQSIEERSVTGPDAQRVWSEAIASIAASPKYYGLTLTPQMGLIPIGPDPDSGFWEFAHLATGEAPVRDDAGRIVRTESMCVVLVLIPGGTFWMGAQKTDPGGQNYDPDARGNESPVHEVTLTAHFLSKYEMTQGQWQRLAGRNPAYHKQNKIAPTLLHPVEQVSWEDAVLWLPRVGLSLPSEAQWEYGARAGTTWPRWVGETKEALMSGQVNIADRSFVGVGGSAAMAAELPELDDGSVVHWEVGHKPANGFGLHEVLGNVWEWCLDGYGDYPNTLQRNPVTRSLGSASRVLRGGSFVDTASYARSAYRHSDSPENRDGYLGLRPSQGITP